VLRWLRWRPTGKQVSAGLGALILLFQTFNSGPEKPTLILVAGGLFIGTPLVKLLDEKRNGDGDSDHR
jgi:hypothetical protein